MARMALSGVEQNGTESRDGLFFWNGQHGVLVDYLFDSLVTAWSNMPETTYQIKQRLTKAG